MEETRTTSPTVSHWTNAKGTYGGRSAGASDSEPEEKPEGDSQADPSRITCDDLAGGIGRVSWSVRCAAIKWTKRGAARRDPQPSKDTGQKATENNKKTKKKLRGNTNQQERRVILNRARKIGRQRTKTIRRRAWEGLCASPSPPVSARRKGGRETRTLPKWEHIIRKETK
jgi:hypothetical protein